MFSQIQNTISESLTKYTNIILTRSAHATRWFQKCSSSLMVQIIAPYVQTPQFISRISDTSVKVRFSMSIKTNTTNTISFTSQSDLTTSRPIDKPLQSLYTSHNIPVNQHDIRIPSAKQLFLYFKSNSYVDCCICSYPIKRFLHEFLEA